MKPEGILVGLTVATLVATAISSAVLNRAYNHFGVIAAQVGIANSDLLAFGGLGVLLMVGTLSPLLFVGVLLIQWLDTSAQRSTVRHSLESVGLSTAFIVALWLGMYLIWADQVIPLASLGLLAIVFSLLPVGKNVVVKTSQLSLMLTLVIPVFMGADAYNQAGHASEKISRGNEVTFAFIDIALSRPVCLTPARKADPLPLPAKATLLGTATNGIYSFWTGPPRDGPLYRVPSASVIVRARASYDANC